MTNVLVIQGKSMPEDARIIRGGVINDLAVIEGFMVQILAVHFCYGKTLQDEFIELLMYNEKVSFSVKLDIVKKLLLRYVPEFKANEKLLFGYLDTVMQERNNFAHCELDVSEEAERRYPAEIGFQKRGVSLWYTNESLKILNEKLVYCMDKLMKLLVPIAVNAPIESLPNEDRDFPGT